MHTPQMGLPQTRQVSVAGFFRCRGQKGTDAAATGETATVGTAAAVAASFWRIISLARSVPSAPQPGQLTRTGIRPYTGSMSNANRVPHGHWTLTSIARVSGSVK